MTYQEMLENARTCIGEYCKACPVCNGRACRNQMPGPGAKGAGDTAIRNYDKWQEIRVNMDTLCPNDPVDTGLELFGKHFRFPFFAGPVGAVNLHYGDAYNDESYNEVLVSACAASGIAAFTGDGTNPAVMRGATAAISRAGGAGVPTVKPWNLETVLEKMDAVTASGAFAAAMDVDAAGLPFLKNMTPPAGRKSVEELKNIVGFCKGVPFIVKGIMTVKGALKAKEAGAAGIVVSNHGGRVLDQCPSTAEVLEEIVRAVDGSMKIFVDGGIRSGTDVFKALALGADAVIIARPFVTAVYGGGAEGVAAYVDKIGSELADTMSMCGASSLEDITRDMIWSPGR
ncbi:alpha-hydroxy-acid oxidizing protein [Qiania dongpingensis]|uniref:L-lactate oxidase n=1 Tax=Qiania dongpingensis TaxID=2763669 RepID=A0A7G9G2H5_9FIRM|nr:alpha-hydroxy-acid oxidizing protein [Qiania dongpingensis]QNM05007.1 alpha-hydroxy-acid oxidizing protein [Qiania dongpingensis]